jgi:hypothetical protein
MVDGRRHPARTNARGTAHLYRLPTRQHVDIAVDQSCARLPGHRDRRELRPLG